MIRYLGYACINESLKPLSFRSCRLKTIQAKGVSYLKEIILHNLKLVHEILLWNISHDIYFYRISSDIMPLVPHPLILASPWQWKEDREIRECMSAIKQLVIQHGLRLSMHPDQYTVMNSKREDVVTRSKAYLVYHGELLDALGGSDIILHIGGVYGNKTAAKKRFIKNILQLDSGLLGYIRIENDDKSYTIDDLLEIADETGLSVVFDYHHHRCHHVKPLTSETIDRIIGTWQGVPKLHISTGRSHALDRSHHDYVTMTDLEALEVLFWEYQIDIMVEAKKKDLAVLALMRSKQ